MLEKQEIFLARNNLSGIVLQNAMHNGQIAIYTSAWQVLYTGMFRAFKRAIQTWSIELFPAL